MLDAKSERAVTGVAEQLHALFGAHLVAVAVYGSAAGDDFVPGASDINLVAVLDKLAYHHLRALRPYATRWRKDRIATPLLVDRSFLRSATDVFPMELHDMRGQHRIVYGEDVFSQLAVSDQHLRYQCEFEARSKLLKLRRLYVEFADPRALQELMLDSLKTFIVVMRHLVHLRGQPPLASYPAVLAAFSRTFACRMPVMTHLLEIKLAKAQWSGDAEDTFRRYLGEVEQLVQTIDRLVIDDTSSPGGA